MSGFSQLSPSRRFSRIVNRLDQRLRNVENQWSLKDLADGSIPPEPILNAIDTELGPCVTLYGFLESEHANAIERGSPILKGISSEIWERYASLYWKKSTVEAAWRELVTFELIGSSSVGPPDQDASDAEVPAPGEDAPAGLDTGANAVGVGSSARGAGPIAQIMLTGVEMMASAFESGDVDASQHDIDGAFHVVESIWFCPDQWYATSLESRLMVLGKGDTGVPFSVRRIVNDCYCALVTGNPAATIALSRALLEAALLDRGQYVLDKEWQNEAEKVRSGQKGLARLVEAYRRSGFSLDYGKIERDVIGLANKILHGSEDGIEGIRSQKKAKECLAVCVEAVETLYRAR